MSEDESPDDRRRLLVRVIIALAIGIPVALEALTFGGLLGDRVFGGGGDGEPTTTTASGVGIGDELPVDSPAVERLVGGEISTAGDGRTLTLTVEVENVGAVPCALSLETVTTAAGEGVAGGAATGQVAPGETVSVTGTWTLPAGATPASVTVVATTYGETTRRQATAVPLGKLPVRG